MQDVTSEAAANLPVSLNNINIKAPGNAVSDLRGIPVKSLINKVVFTYIHIHTYNVTHPWGLTNVLLNVFPFSKTFLNALFSSMFTCYS